MSINSLRQSSYLFVSYNTMHRYASPWYDKDLNILSGYFIFIRPNTASLFLSLECSVFLSLHIPFSRYPPIHFFVTSLRTEFTVLHSLSHPFFHSNLLLASDNIVPRTLAPMMKCLWLFHTCPNKNGRPVYVTS